MLMLLHWSLVLFCSEPERRFSEAWAMIPEMLVGREEPVRCVPCVLCCPFSFTSRSCLLGQLDYKSTMEFNAYLPPRPLRDDDARFIAKKDTIPGFTDDQTKFVQFILAYVFRVFVLVVSLG